jgi:hypothetical protein
MKRVLFFVVSIVVLVPLFAQESNNKIAIPIDETTNEIVFSEVVHVNGTKAELFKRCVYWLNDYYKDPTRVTLVRDANTGKIVGRHVFPIYKVDSTTKEKQRIAKIYYTFTVRFKDDRYKWQIDKLELVSKDRTKINQWLDTGDPRYNKEWKGYLTQITDFVDNWSKSLKEKMQPEVAGKEEDDW